MKTPTGEQQKIIDDFTAKINRKVNPTLIGCGLVFAASVVALMLNVGGGVTFVTMLLSLMLFLGCVTYRHAEITELKNDIIG